MGRKCLSEKGNKRLSGGEGRRKNGNSFCKIKGKEGLKGEEMNGKK